MPNWSSRRGRTRSRSSSGWSPRAPGCPASSSRSRHSIRSSSTWSGRTRRGPRRGRMHKVWAVVRREFVERIRSKWFWVMALLGPVFFGVVFLLPALLAGRAGIKRIVVVDGTTGPVGARLTELLDQSGVFHAVRVEHAGVDPQVVARARIRVHLVTQKIAGGRTTGESAAQSFSLAYFMAIILYTAILIYGINVMSSVLEEKTTRIVEVLVSSLRPFQLMLGKVLGVGAVSVFQFLIWGASARLLLAWRPSFLGASGVGEAEQVFQVPHVGAATAALFIIYFLGGFFLYSAMFAAVGAMSSSEQEARQAQQPVAWLLVLSFVSMFGMLNDPSSAFAVTLSLVPFSAPIAMPVRWAAGTLPTYEVALSLVVLALAIVGVTWVAARIYRVGMLMTGKRPNVRELVRWVRAA